MESGKHYPSVGYQHIIGTCHASLPYLSLHRDRLLKLIPVTFIDSKWLLQAGYSLSKSPPHESMLDDSMFKKELI